MEITGDIQMQGGNHLNPGCMKGDGSSGDGRDVPDVYVGGNATLIYDNKNSTAASPAIEGTYGCEMKGDVTLDVRAGRVAGIVGTEEPVDKSIIRGNLHIIAGNPAYENTDRVLRLGSNWPIIGAGNSFALYPGAVGNYTVGGNITIDTYENAWAWDKGTEPDSYDLPEIYGALRGNVGGNITINAHGSHVQNIFGASDSVVQGSVTVNATDVELKNSEYNTEYDEGYIFGLWERGVPATANGPVTVTVNGGDVGLVMATDQTTVPAGSSINVTGKPKIRTGIRGTQASSYSTEFPVANVYACEATIPFIKGMSQVNITNNSAVTAHIMTSNAGLMVEEGSTLTTDNGQVWIWAILSLTAPGSSCTARPTITTIFCQRHNADRLQRPPDQSRHKQPEWCGNQQWRNGADGPAYLQNDTPPPTANCGCRQLRPVQITIPVQFRYK